MRSVFTDSIFFNVDNAKVMASLSLNAPSYKVVFILSICYSDRWLWAVFGVIIIKINKSFRIFIQRKQSIIGIKVNVFSKQEYF
ncbi:hypothetical protein EGY05_06020 [Chryseobacterium arthrosphaerae]|nr:hypothetical protein EGY05_06020 [Chryseobacterium arthrosphaerae]